MSKVFIFFVVFAFNFWQIFFLPNKTYALIPGENHTKPCSDTNTLITLDAPETGLTNQPALTIGLGKPFGINVKIPDSIAQNNWKYYVVVLAHPDLNTEHLTAYDNRIKGDSPSSTESINGEKYRVYHWDFAEGALKRPLFRTEFNDFSIELKHSEETLGVRTVGADICLGPEKQLRTINNTLSQVNSCPITMSENFKSGDPVTGTVTVKEILGVAYGYRINKGEDVSSLVPKNSLDPKPLSQMPGYNPLKPFLLSFQFDDILTPGNNIKLPPKTDIENGTHTAAIYAATQQGTEYFLFACGTRVFKVSNDPTTSPTTTGGTSVIPGSGGGAGGSKKVCLLEVDPTCTSSSPSTTQCGGGNNPGIKTAIGCLHTEPIALIKDFLRFLTAISGGIAFLMMLLGAFQMITSAGNPETLQAGRDRFQSAIIGLLFVIFSVLLMKIIGVDILGLGSFLGVPK